MDGLIQWVKNLIFIILFTSLLEMFLPENNMRKYVRVVMGFFIITVLISPLLLVFRQNFSVIQDVIPENMINNNWNKIEEQGREIEEANHKLLLNYYENKVATRVKEVISLNYDNYQQEIRVSLNNNYMIEFLSIVLIDRGIDRVEIENVNIATNNPRDKDEQTEKQMAADNRDKKESLTNKLSQVFQIPRDSIEVIIKKGG